MVRRDRSVTTITVDDAQITLTDGGTAPVVAPPYQSPLLLSRRRYPVISGDDVTCFRFHVPIKLESFRVRDFAVRDSSGFRGDSCRVSQFSISLGNFVHSCKVMPPKKSKKANKHNQDWADDDDDSAGESVAYCTLYP